MMTEVSIATENDPELSSLARNPKEEIRVLEVTLKGANIEHKICAFNLFTNRLETVRSSITATV